MSTSTTAKLTATLSYGLNMPKAKPKPGALNAFGAAAKAKPNPMANSKLAGIAFSAVPRANNSPSNYDVCLSWLCGL
jgi:hypothetical protein